MTLSMQCTNGYNKTGAGTAASRLGMPDLGVVTMNDMATNAGMIASLDRTVPLIADADTGYGGPIMVSRTVKAYISAGVAGLHLEDQVLSKRCGHLLGKQIVNVEEYISRIKAAVLAREEMKAAVGEAGDIVLIARTDALQVNGFEDAIERLRMAIVAGADVAFLEGPTDVNQCKAVCQRLAPTPVLLNMVPGGATPHMTAAEAKESGFRLIIYPGLMLSAVLASCSLASAHLKTHGDIEIPEGEKHEGPKALFEVCGLVNCMEFDQQSGGKTYEKGV